MISSSLDHLPLMLGGADVSFTIEQPIPLSGIRGHRRASDHRMGSGDHDPEERPEHRVSVDGFWIDRFPGKARGARRDMETTPSRTAGLSKAPVGTSCNTTKVSCRPFADWVRPGHCLSWASPPSCSPSSGEVLDTDLLVSDPQLLRCRCQRRIRRPQSQMPHERRRQQMPHRSNRCLVRATAGRAQIRRHRDETRPAPDAFARSRPAAACAARPCPR